MTASSNAALLRAVLDVQRIETKLFFAVTLMIAEETQKSKELKNSQGIFLKSFFGTKRLI